MSAPGIQLGTELHLSYFQPDVREYLQKLEQAIVADSLSAARQAYAQLQKSVAPSTSQAIGHGNAQASLQVRERLQTLGQALESGQLSEAGSALAELRAKMRFAAAEGTASQVPSQSSTSENQSASAGTANRPDVPGSDSGRNINVRA